MLARLWKNLQKTNRQNSPKLTTIPTRTRKICRPSFKLGVGSIKEVKTNKLIEPSEYITILRNK